MVVDYADVLMAESTRRMMDDCRRRYEDGRLELNVVACAKHIDEVLESAIRVAAFMRIARQAKTS